MRIHCIIHAAFEKPGVIEKWVEEKGHGFSKTRIYKGEKPPKTNEFDFLIVMGGPQSPLYISKWPYLQDEMNLIKKSIEANKAILGICLGAQLIAEALDAKTERSPHREIGVFPIELLPLAEKDPIFSQFPQIFPAMHWHNDMPGIIKDAKLLAKSAGCPRQVFSIGDRIYGLQCHLEMTRQNISNMITHCKKELIPDLYIHSKQQLLSYDFHDMNRKMSIILDYFSTFFVRKLLI